MATFVRPLPKSPIHPIYKLAGEPVRQYLLLWNLAHFEDNRAAEIDYVQIAAGPPSSKPKIIVSSRARDLDNTKDSPLESAAQLGLLALGKDTVFSLTPNQQSVDLGDRREGLLASLVAGRQPWLQGTINIDDRPIDALIAKAQQEWICIAATTRTSLAIVGRESTAENIRLTAIPERAIYRMTQPNGQVISE